MTARESIAVHSTESAGRVPFSQLAAYGAGGIIPIALFNIAGILVGLMGNISLGLSAFWLGVILIIPRLWDAVSDPMIGHLSDNTRTRWGRRRPYLLLGGVFVAISFVVMWWIPKGDAVKAWFATDTGFQAFQLGYILFALLLFFTACTVFEIPHGALGMELTTDYHERTRLFSAKSFVGNLFAMSTPWLLAVANMERFKGSGNEADGMRYVSIMIAAVLIPLSFWWFFSLSEPGFVHAAKHEKTPFWAAMKRTVRNRNFVRLTLTIFTLAMGFNFVQLLGSYIPIFYVFGGDKVAGAYLLGINGTVWAITGLLAVFPLNWISPKLGKRNTLAVAILLMCLAQLSKIVCYNPAYPYLIVVPTVLLSAGMLFFFTLGASMVGDICDEDELQTGYRAEGSFYSVFWWLIKMGTAFASFVAGALIVLTAFDETQVTKVDSIQGILRGIRGDAQFWSDNPAVTGNSVNRQAQAKTRVAQALDEAQQYLGYLEREAAKQQRPAPSGSESRDRQRDALQQTLSSVKSTAVRLAQIEASLAKPDDSPDHAALQAAVTEAIPLTLQTKLAKAKLNALELMLHLESASQKHRRSAEHYQAIIRDSASVYERISSLDPASSPETLARDLTAVESETVSLTKQTPYSLLMMRVVEIGLPVLLSVCSLVILLRYSLTERRSQEIKEVLKHRNEARGDS